MSCEEEEMRAASWAVTVERIRQAESLYDIMDALVDWDRFQANADMDGGCIGDIVDESGVCESLGLLRPWELPGEMLSAGRRDTIVVFCQETREVLDYDGGFSIYTVD